MRVGQKNGLVRQWAPRGSRPRQPADQRYESTYIFGAVCPARDTGVALILPRANTDAMQRHLDEISAHVSQSAVAVVLMDQAAWHTTGRLDWPRQCARAVHPCPLPGTQPGRADLAVSAPDLSIKPDLSELRRHT